MTTPSSTHSSNINPFNAFIKLHDLARIQFNKAYTAMYKDICSEWDAHTTPRKAGIAINNMSNKKTDGVAVTKSSQTVSPLSGGIATNAHITKAKLLKNNTMSLMGAPTPKARRVVHGRTLLKRNSSNSKGSPRSRKFHQKRSADSIESDLEKLIDERATAASELTGAAGSAQEAREDANQALEEKTEDPKANQDVQERIEDAHTKKADDPKDEQEEALTDTTHDAKEDTQKAPTATPQDPKETQGEVVA